MRSRITHLTLALATLSAAAIAPALLAQRTVADQAASMKLISDHLLGAIPLGEVLLSKGRFDDAAQVGQRSLKLARTHGQRGHEVYALRLLGEVAARRDPPNREMAEPYYHGAMKLALELGMRPLVAHCHLGLGKLSRRTGQRKQAREHLTTATTMYREMGMTYWLEQAEAEMRELG